MHAAGPDPWPGGCERGGGDTMTAPAADDLEAAGLLALARLDDGAPGRSGPAMAPAWPPRTGHEGTTQTPGATGVRPGRQGSNGRQEEACRADQPSPRR
jgi:hypothetical protein